MKASPFCPSNEVRDQLDNTPSKKQILCQENGSEKLDTAILSKSNHIIDSSLNTQNLTKIVAWLFYHIFPYQ